MAKNKVVVKTESVLIGLKHFKAITKEPDFSQTCGFWRVMKNAGIFHFYDNKRLMLNEFFDSPVFDP